MSLHLSLQVIVKKFPIVLYLWKEFNENHRGYSICDDLRVHGDDLFIYLLFRSRFFGLNLYTRHSTSLSLSLSLFLSIFHLTLPRSSEFSPNRKYKSSQRKLRFFCASSLSLSARLIPIFPLSFPAVASFLGFLNFSASRKPGRVVHFFDGGKKFSFEFIRLATSVVHFPSSIFSPPRSRNFHRYEIFFSTATILSRDYYLQRSPLRFTFIRNQTEIIIIYCCHLGSSIFECLKFESSALTLKQILITLIYPQFFRSTSKIYFWTKEIFHRS